MQPAASSLESSGTSASESIHWQRLFGKFCPAPSRQTTPTFSSGHMTRSRRQYLKCGRPSAAHLGPAVPPGLQHHWSTCELIPVRLLGVRWPAVVVPPPHSRCLLCVFDVLQVVLTFPLPGNMLHYPLLSECAWGTSGDPRAGCKSEKKKVDLTDFICLCARDSRAGSMAALRRR